MIRTLHWYLSRELLRVSLLALVALTLLMTVFGIIEPIRKVGLASDQVLGLFGYLIPVMLSLTLPVAALFAATITYGRFSQENELLACRASGISTLSLLKPALVLGGVVTVLALALNNFVAPVMLGGAEQAVKQNIRGIVFHQLRKMNHLKYSNWLIHADSADPSSQMIHGVVVMDTRRKKNRAVAVARAAKVQFRWHKGEAYIRIQPQDLVHPGAEQEGRFSKAPLSHPIPGYGTEKPSWYDWPKLVRTLQYPETNQEIDREWSKIKHRIANYMIARDVAATLWAGREYDRLGRQDRRILIAAKGARLKPEEKVELVPWTDAEGGAKPIKVKVVSGDRIKEIATGLSGSVEATSTLFDRETHITVQLLDNVYLRQYADTPEDQALARADWQRGQIVVPESMRTVAAKIAKSSYDLGEIEVPEELKQKADAVTLQDGYRYVADPAAHKDVISVEIAGCIDDLRKGRINSLLGKVTAEMHCRSAYGISCFLMVAMGAALGLIFRGGHFIVAFVLALIPAAVVIVMMLMGKEMIRNPDVSDIAGMACIWGGIAMLATANGVVYFLLSRK